MGNSVALIKFALALMTSLYVYTFTGQIEGYILPVVNDTEITRIEPVGRFYSRVWGSSNRIRECDFAGLEWEFNAAPRSVAVSVVFEEGTVIREQGRFDFGPWLIHLSPNQLRFSTAFALHECHPFFTTRSVFWPVTPSVVNPPQFVPQEIE